MLINILIEGNDVYFLPRMFVKTAFISWTSRTIFRPRNYLRPLHSPGHLLIPVQHVCKLGSWRSPAFGCLVCTPDPWSMLFSLVQAHHNSHFITLLNCITVYLPVGCVDVTLQGKFQYGKWNTVPVIEPDQQEEHYIRSIKRCECMWGFFVLVVTAHILVTATEI